MSTSIFIKTCLKDLEWLRYCLESIRKYAVGFDEVVIVADRSCIGHINSILNGTERVAYVKDQENGYIYQQYVKLHADAYVRSECVLFVDSDVVFHTEFTPEEFMRDGKPILLKTRYGNLGLGDMWKGVTESHLGWTIEFEYMRRMPLLYLKDTLTAFRNAYPELVQRIREMPGRSFSEFNAIGAFIERYEPHKYFIVDTEVWSKPMVAKQFWSWGGITEETRDEMRRLISMGQ